jgi:metal transporter CNNM
MTVPEEAVESKGILYSLFQYSMIVILICFSAMFSGLTLGLMSLDKIGLEVRVYVFLCNYKPWDQGYPVQVVIGAGMSEGADENQIREAKYAKKIEPLRKDGNLLLCTLLLGNVAVNSLLSILMADLTSGTMGFVVSTVAIVIFGEIAPQATCARYALRIGAFAVPIVQMMVYLLFVFTWPLAKALNIMLGDEIGKSDFRFSKPADVRHCDPPHAISFGSLVLPLCTPHTHTITTTTPPSLAPFRYDPW